MSPFAETKIDGHSDHSRLMPIDLRRFGWVALLCFVALSTAGNAAQGQSAADDLLAKGMALKGEGDLGGAAAAFAEAITLNPKQANVHNLLGAAYEKLGRPSQAIRKFDAARLLENGAYKSGERSFQLAAQLDDSPAQMYLALGDFYLGKRKSRRGPERLL